MNVFYSDQFVIWNAPPQVRTETSRKAGWVYRALTEHPIQGIEWVAPELLSVEQLRTVHSDTYVQAVRTGIPAHLAESPFGAWIPDIWRAARASNGGVLAAAHAALRDGAAGSLSSGLHHAERDHGKGFCTFNGLALAARATLEAGVTSVLILDFDAHCGGGTHSLVCDDPHIWHADVAVHPFDAYQPGERALFTFVTRASQYLPAINATLHELKNVSRFDLCLYNAGMDPDERCGVGGLEGITYELLAERERRVFAWCREQRVPVAFVLAGGYIGSRLSQDDLVALHCLTLESASETARNW